MSSSLRPLPAGRILVGAGVLLVVGCSGPPEGAGPGPMTTDPSPTAPTYTPSSSEPTTASTSTLPTPVVEPAIIVALDGPFGGIFDITTVDHGGRAVVAAYGDDLFFVDLSGLPDGEHSMEAEWDGVSRIEQGYLADLLPAGDVDGDGHLDYWRPGGLLHGPLLGRSHTTDELSPRTGWEPVVAAGFDADGDGIDDIVTTAGSGLSYIRYGPFGDQLVDISDATDPGPYTQLGGYEHGVVSTEATVLRDHIGPGLDVLLIGHHHGFYSYDSPGTRAYPLQQVRGGVVPFEQSRGAFHNACVALSPNCDLGDVDGDGAPDFVFDGPSLRIGAGPIDPVTYSYVPRDYTEQEAAISVAGGHPIWGIGDLNGDGVQELAVVDPEVHESVVVVFSPHIDPIAAADGVVVGTLGDDWGHHTFDVDGDGLLDVVVQRPSADFDQDQLRIWRGADLLAAHRAGSR